MSDGQPAKPWEPGGRPGRLGLLLAGIILGQALLYGSSLAGWKILLPLDILAAGNVYTPETPEFRSSDPENVVLSDLVLLFEPQRRFVVSQLRAGQLPMWAPYQYAGSPSLWPKFSPFLLLQSLTESPVILAWAQLFVSMVAGLGIYLFLRRSVGVGFWPAAISGWCYPLTGFFVLWQGFQTGYAVYWLPWVLLAVDKTVRRTHRLAPIGLALVTFLVLASGHLDVGGQVLLIAGIYALWAWFDGHKVAWRKAASGQAVLSLAAGWTLGALLAAPHILPLMEYAQTGSRMTRRVAGQEERPPGNWQALPQAVLPDVNGRVSRNSIYIGNGKQQESASGAYAGLLATLVLAPLAWCSPRHRSGNNFWVFLAVFALSWTINLPGFVQVLRLPGLNMMSHNRLVFAAAFAFLVLAAVGLEALSKGLTSWRRWFWIAPGILAALLVWCLDRVSWPPEPLATRLQVTIQQGGFLSWVRDLEGLAIARDSFAGHCDNAAILCGAGLAAWFLVRYFAGLRRWLPCVGIVLLAEMIWSGRGRSIQSDPALYYPPIPVLTRLSQTSPGRIIGDNCLPPTLCVMNGLRDIRGYDGIDPAHIVELILLGADPESFTAPYALTQYMMPRETTLPEGGVRLHPVLDMLNVRFVIRRGSPPTGVVPAFSGTDYYVLENQAALPRAYVPRGVETEPDPQKRLKKMGAHQFDPRQVAYVEHPMDLPNSCSGTAKILEDAPTRIIIQADMQTAGMMVLADRWDKGWKAYLGTKPLPIARVNHALRGVVLPPGTSTLIFEYQPASLRLGIWLCASGAVILLVFAGTLTGRFWIRGRRI